MSYIALARKWRPKRFAEMVGQEHVLRALANALDSGKVHHAFLFTGTRGVGKTTTARSPTSFFRFLCASAGTNRLISGTPRRSAGARRSPPQDVERRDQERAAAQPAIWRQSGA